MSQVPLFDEKDRIIVDQQDEINELTDLLLSHRRGMHMLKEQLQDRDEEIKHLNSLLDSYREILQRTPSGNIVPYQKPEFIGQKFSSRWIPPPQPRPISLLPQQYPVPETGTGTGIGTGQLSEEELHEMFRSHTFEELSEEDFGRNFNEDFNGKSNPNRFRVQIPTASGGWLEEPKFNSVNEVMHHLSLSPEEKDASVD